MKRKIIRIDRERCNGCGACAKACHEGAIEIINGKAELVREHFCDGLGDCLPECPTGAISFEEREAPAYDEKAVKEAQKNQAAPTHMGCPGAKSMQIRRPVAPGTDTPAPTPAQMSALRNWPVQIKQSSAASDVYKRQRLCLRKLSPGFYPEQADPHRLPQIGPGGLQRKADRNHSRQRHSKRNHCKNGSSLLRRSGNGGQESTSKQREIHPLAGRHHQH